jgi:hypothetical protein
MGIISAAMAGNSSRRPKSLITDMGR